MNNIKVIRTANNMFDKLTRKEDIKFKKEENPVEFKVINIYKDIEFQEIVGFGGAFTQSVSLNLDTLDSEKREELLNAYFNPQNGIGYTLCRTHINSCDFGLENYDYVEKQDKLLKSFNIEPDKKSLIRMINDSIKIGNAQFKLIASPWSPPAWMKDTGKMIHGGKLKSEYKKLWAQYIVKYIKEYKKQGIDIWGVTFQNEPNANQRWESCLYNDEEEADFIGRFLGPTFKEQAIKSHIFMWDHNKERIYERACKVLNNPYAYNYVDGIAYHWYTGDHFEALNLTHQKFTDKFLISTEGCHGVGKRKDEWYKAEHYAHDIIGNLNNFSNGFIDWNMILDKKGGPTYVNNFCDSPVYIDVKKKKIVYQYPYYILGHFSKYIRPGAKRIGFSSYHSSLQTCAFKNKDNSIVVVILNRSNEDLDINLRCDGNIAQIKIIKHSIYTLIIS